MESSGLQCDTVAHPTELLITCTNADPQSGETELELEDASQQQISTLAEQFHFIDQDGKAIRYEIQALSGTSPQMMILASESENGQVFHVNVIPSSQTTTAQLLIPQDPVEHNQTRENLQTVQTVSGSAAPENAGGLIIHSNTAFDVSQKSSNRLSVEQFPKPLQPLPPNIPVWARRLRSCEKIGDSYRGYCLSEAELMNILGLHKQHTMSVWGTRQSPSPAKPATRLMWKSQYVPYDGIPFINAGSRAIVMECQYGPRRKGSQPKKSVESDITGQMYKATCPARIYIKKVKKFPIYRVPTDPKIDKKMIKLEQEKAFNLLKKDLETNEGVFRWYVQLPDQEAHQYHSLDPGCFSNSPTPFQPPNEEEEEMICEENSTLPSRLHPYVAEKIRELVAKGIDEVYAVRKQLRKFVERELFKPDDIPERHNLSYFPTVNDLKNHIHEAQKSVGSGELIYEQETIPTGLQWSSDSGSVLGEMVTVTFESSSLEEQDSLIKVQSSSEDDCHDTAQLISSLTSLQPKIFAQLQSLQLQSSFTSPDGTTALIAVNQPSPTFTSPDETAALITVNPQTPSFTSSDGRTALITVNHESPSFTSSDVTTSLISVGQSGLLNAGTSNQPLVLGHLRSQHSDSVSAVAALSPSGHNHLVSMGQLVTVEDPTSSLSGEVHQILLGELHPIPIRILDNQSTIVEIGSVDAFCTEQSQDKPRDLMEDQTNSEGAGATDCQDPA